MRASQLHKLNVRGETSDFQFAVTMKSLTQHGTDAIFATIEVNGFGNIGDDLDVVTDIGGGSVASQYTVIAAAEVDTVMAAGIATDINSQTDHTATSTDNVVQILKTTSGTVKVVTVSIG